jgi:hypothetical protein
LYYPGPGIPFGLAGLAFLDALPVIVYDGDFALVVSPKFSYWPGPGFSLLLLSLNLMPIANRGCLYFGGSVYDPGPGKNTTSFDDGGIRLSLPNTYVAAFRSVGA